MLRTFLQMQLAALAMVSAFGVPAALAAEDAVHVPRKGVLLEYGVQGHIQPIGIHHGFHIDNVVAKSRAEKDGLMRGDIIVKVNGDTVRSDLALIEELFVSENKDGVAVLTVRKAGSAGHVVIKAQID